MRPAAVWAWRAACLAALIWIGYNLHRIERQMPSDYAYETKEAVQNIARDTDAIRESLGARRAPSPGIDAFIDALPARK